MEPSHRANPQLQSSEFSWLLSQMTVASCPFLGTSEPKYLSSHCGLLCPSLHLLLNFSREDSEVTSSHCASAELSCPLPAVTQAPGEHATCPPSSLQCGLSSVSPWALLLTLDPCRVMGTHLLVLFLTLPILCCKHRRGFFLYFPPFLCLPRSLHITF